MSAETGYALFHAVDLDAGLHLLHWALDHQPPHKVLSSYNAMQFALQTGDLRGRVTRDHRELYLSLAPGSSRSSPIGSTASPARKTFRRLIEYNELYNRERQTNWRREWRDSISCRIVYVRERGRLASPAV